MVKEKENRKMIKIKEHVPFVGFYNHKGDILIDKDVKDEWRKFLIYHEKVEYRLVSNGIHYKEAHEIATKKEMALFKRTFGSDWKRMWDKYSEHIDWGFAKEYKFKQNKISRSS